MFSFMAKAFNFCSNCFKRNENYECCGWQPSNSWRFWLLHISLCFKIRTQNWIGETFRPSDHRLKIKVHMVAYYT